MGSLGAGTKWGDSLVAYGIDAIIELLLKAGADKAARTNDGKTPRNVAALYGKPGSLGQGGDTLEAYGIGGDHRTAAEGGGRSGCADQRWQDAAGCRSAVWEALELGPGGVTPWRPAA